MPPETTPQPAHTWGKPIFILVCAALVLVAAFITLYPRDSQEVRMLVRDMSGSRTLYTLSVPSGSTKVVSDVDPASITTLSMRLFRLPDGSIVTLDEKGIVTRQGSSKGAVSVLIASPVRPSLKTPLAVWGAAEKIAWVNPTDQSLQVFGKTSRGAYAPLFLDAKIHASSLGFTKDGSTLVVVQTVVTQDGTSTSKVFSIHLTTSSVSEITSITGFATIVP